MAKRPWRKRRAMTPRRLKKQRWQPGWPTCWEWDTTTPPILSPVVSGFGGAVTLVVDWTTNLLDPNWEPPILGREIWGDPV